MSLILEGGSSSPSTTQEQTYGWLRRQVSRKAEGRENFFWSTATAGTTTSVSYRGRHEETNRWKYAEVYFASGANAGETRLVEASAPGSLSWADSLDSAVTAGDEFEVRRLYWTEETQAAIREALLAAFRLAKIEIEDTDTFVEDQTSYTVPDLFTHLRDVLYTDDDGVTVSVGFRHWRLSGEEVVLDATAQGLYEDGDTITFRGYRNPILPDSDEDLIEVESSYVIWYAVATLKGQDFSSAQVDPDDDARAFSTFMQFDVSRTEFMRTRMKPNTKRVR